MTKLNTAKELQADEKIEYDSTLSGKIFETKNPQWHTTKHVNTYFIDCLDAYESYGRIDEELWESFQEDFEDWTEALFTLGNKKVRTTLRDFLRDNGVYVGGTKYISQQLFNVLKQDAYEEWPAEEIEKQLKTGRDFNSYQNPMFRAKMEARNHGLQVKESVMREQAVQQLPQMQPRQTQVQPPQEQQQPHTNLDPRTTMALDTTAMKTSHDTVPERGLIQQTSVAPPTRDLPTKALTDLGKLYHDDALKFGGEKYDILDAKLKIFRELCRKADIQPDYYHEAFSTMLKGRAHQFYYDHLAERNFDFDEMIRRVKAFFHTTENLQLYLQEWRSTTLRSIIMQNPDNDLSQNLELLIDKLQKIQKGLSTNHQSDYNLRDQLVNACQGVPECKMVLLKPSATFESVASDLRNAVGVEMRCQNQVPQQYFGSDHDHHSNPHDDDYNANRCFWVDRRYGSGNKGRERRFPREQGYKYGNYGPRGGGRYNGSKNKKCFVCGKEGCWSTKHSTSERKSRQNKWRQYAQEKGQGVSASDFEAFLMEFEGVDIGEWDNDNVITDFDTWYAANEKSDEHISQQNTQYLTSYGTVDGDDIVAILDEQAAFHGFTKVDIFSQDPLEPANQFQFRDRYSSKTF